LVSTSALLLAGCGGERPVGDLPDVSTTSDDAGPNGNDAGVVNQMPITTLAGIWDITVSSGGSSPEQITITLDSETLLIAAGQATFTVTQIGNDWQFQGSGSNHPMASGTQHPSAFSTGALALNLGGDWSVNSTSFFSCNGTFGTGMQSTCAGVNIDGASTFTGNFTGTRVASESSIFGDLGGQWMFTDNGGASCMAEFKDSRITYSCTNAGDFAGTFVAVFGDGILSGNASSTEASGIEFSGHRR
jgi:hypothetical protein